MNRLLALSGAFVLCATSGFAATVNFENEAPLNPDPTLIAVGNTYTNGGITFSSTEVMKLVGVGPNPISGFVPNDTPGSTSSGPANFGAVFLTGDFLGNTNMTLDFAAATDIAFDIVDIDGGDDSVVGDDQEENFVFTFLNSGLVQGTAIVNSRDLTGILEEAGVVSVAFSGLFDSVEIVGTTPGGSRNIGWGIDNIVTTEAQPSPVPLPAGAALMLTALGGFGVMRRRKKTS